MTLVCAVSAYIFLGLAEDVVFVRRRRIEHIHHLATAAASAEAAKAVAS
jgi:hypothetical protein